MSRTAAASGRFRKKTQRHETFCTSQPPSTGPEADVRVVQPDHAPMALPRASPLKLALMRARLPGVSSAPPAPCTARARIRDVTFGASPHQSDAR